MKIFVFATVFALATLQAQESGAQQKPIEQIIAETEKAVAESNTRMEAMEAKSRAYEKERSERERKFAVERLERHEAWVDKEAGRLDSALARRDELEKQLAEDIKDGDRVLVSKTLSELWKAENEIESAGAGIGDHGKLLMQDASETLREDHIDRARYLALRSKVNGAVKRASARRTASLGALIEQARRFDPDNLIFMSERLAKNGK